MNKVKILGIVGSPRKGGHTEILMREALKAAEEIGDVETEMLHLAGKKINPCLGCSDEKGNLVCRTDRCVFDDDMTKTIYGKLLEADGFIVGTPSYYGNVTAQLKALFDRCSFVKYRLYRLSDKVGGAFCVAGHAHGGVETAIHAINWWLFMQGMIVVNDGSPTTEDCERLKNVLGPRSTHSVAFDFAHFPGGWADSEYGKIREDTKAIETVRSLGRRVARVTKWTKYAQENLGKISYGSAEARKKLIKE
jgi:multimeric flavodoxin WrbA